MSIRHVLTGLAAATLAACYSVQVQTEAAAGTDFTKYGTFAQAPAPSSAGSALPGYSAITGAHIQASIAHDLETKGLRPAPKDRADLMVAFSIDGQRRQDIEDDGWGYGGGDYTVNYVQGTLTIDIFDNKTKQLVWHAYGQTDIYGSQKNTQLVDKAVAKIMQKFPPEPPQ